MGIFADATKAKIRFTTGLGNLTTEDLWDLPLSETPSQATCLDSIAQHVNQDLTASKQESFVKARTTVNIIAKLKMDVILEIIRVKLDELGERVRRDEMKRKRDRIIEIIANKEDDSLQNKSLASLRKLVDELE